MVPLHGGNVWELRSILWEASRHLPATRAASAGEVRAEAAYHMGRYELKGLEASKAQIWIDHQNGPSVLHQQGPGQVLSIGVWCFGVMYGTHAYMLAVSEPRSKCMSDQEGSGMPLHVNQHSGLTVLPLSRCVDPES